MATRLGVAPSQTARVDVARNGVPLTVETLPRLQPGAVGSGIPVVNRATASCCLQDDRIGTRKGKRALAKDSATEPRRVGAYNPDVETGDVLDDIANTDVEIASVSFDERKGKNGPYTLSIITLTNGNVYHTGSPVVAERLARVPASDYPVMAKFTKEKSQNDPSRSYWTVN